MSRIRACWTTAPRLLFLSLAAVAVGATLGGCGGGSGTALVKRGKAIHGGTDSIARGQALTVGQGVVGPAVPAGFLGLSIEFPGVEDYAGENPAALDPAFVRLIRDLSPGQEGVLRIGGDSTDWTWWPVPHMSRPGGIRYDLTEDWVKVAQALAKALDDRLILGINLEADSRRVAAAEAHALLSGIGSKWIDAFEIGNEPELYGTFGWYTTKGGQHIPGRPRDYDFQDFASDFSTIAGALPRVSLAGPDSGSAPWLQDLGGFLSDERRVGVVTVHAYPTKHCSPSQRVTPADLFSEAASRGLAEQVASYAALAHRHGLALRVDEINSVSCGGEQGLSNAFAPALWALDVLFQMERLGINGVNFHTNPHTLNQLIGAREVHGTWQAEVEPEYYGLIMFAQAAPAGSRLLKVSGPTARGFDSWATRAPDGQIHVVLINEGAAAKSVRLRITSGRGPATLVRLLAPSLQAKSGVTLGGQTLGSETSTGLLAGSSTATTVAPVAGSYPVSVPAGSAAMLTLTAG